MDPLNYKEVYFAEYCPRCVNWEKDQNEQPCEHCLGEPSNINSHKPVDFEEA